MLWGPRHRGVMAQRAGALVPHRPGRQPPGWLDGDRPGGCRWRRPDGREWGWLVPGHRGLVAPVDPRADGSSGGSDPARAVAAPVPAPGSCGSRPMTFPSRTEYPCWRAGPGVSRQAQQSILERSGTSRPSWSVSEWLPPPGHRSHGPDEDGDEQLAFAVVLAFGAPTAGQQLDLGAPDPVASTAAIAGPEQPLLPRTGLLEGAA